MPTVKEVDARVNEMRTDVNQLQETVDEMGRTVKDSDEKLDSILTEIRSTKAAPAIPAVPGGTSAKNQGVSPRKMMEALEVDIPDVTIDEHSLVQRPATVNDVDSPQAKAKLDALKFNNEPVTIYIQEVTDKDAAPCFEVSVNGDKRVFVRGETYTVPRYIVEQMARAKPVHYDNIEYTKDDGERAVRWPGRIGLRYPFSIVQDGNPLGVEWFKRVMKEKN
jgi:hypothetical protein